MPSMPLSHQVACLSVEATSETEKGSLATSQPGLKEPISRQADSSFPQLTLALNSTDLISWWWEKAKHEPPAIWPLRSGTVSKSYQLLFSLSLVM